MNCQAGGYFGWLSDVVAARWGVEATRSKIIPAANDQSVPKSQDAFGNFPVAQKQPEGPIQLALDVKPDGKIAAEITVIKPVDGTTEINPIPASSNQADGPADLFPPSQPPSRSPPRTRNLFRRAFWTKGRTDLVITFTSLAIFGTFVSLFIAMAAGAIPI